MMTLRTKDTVILIAAFAAVILKPALAARWTPIDAGFPSVGVSVNSLVVDPVSPSTVYALATTQNTQVGPGATIVPALFKSTDAAASWAAVGNVSGVTCLAIDPSNSANLYAGTSQGVVKSTDGGQSWTDAGGNLPVASVTRLLIDPVTPSALYAVVIDTPSAPGTAISTSLYKTTDAGASWSALNTGLSSSAYITAIVLAPSDPSTIYVLAPAYNPSIPNGLQVGGLVRSSDAGQTWTPVNSQLLPAILPNSLAVDSNAPNTLYIGDNQGIQKSTDGGQTWNPLNPGLAPNGEVELVVTAASAVYVTGRTFSPTGQVDSLLESTDGGTTWNSLNIGSPVLSSITAVAPDPHDPSHIYASVAGNLILVGGMPIGPPVLSAAVFKTLDGGQTWSSSSAGLAAYDVRAVAIDPADENTVYAGGSGGVFSSSDGGATWSVTGLATYTTLLLADPNSPGSLYALTGSSSGCNSSAALLFSTADAGAHWSSAVSPLNSGCILNGTFSGVNTPPFAIAPTDSTRLYLAESDTMDGFSAILKSTDRAADWSILWDWFNGLSTPVMALAVDPSQPGTVYAGLDDGNAPAGGLFKSVDGGNTWTNIGMTASAVSSLAIDPGNPQVIYAATEGHNTSPAGLQGLFKSTDAGRTWLAIDTGLAALIGARSTTATALAIDPADTQVLYLGTSTSGVYRSSDGGATWNPFNDGLTSLPVRSLAIGGGPSHLVYAVTSNGVFKLAGLTPAPALISGTRR